MQQLTGRDRAKLGCLIVRALACRGWSAEEVARRVGCRRHTITRIRRGEARQVTMLTYRSIEQVYHRLHLQNSTEPGSARTRACALNLGWAGSDVLVALLSEEHPPLPDIVLHY